jgi:hypothetical protein
MIRTALKYAHCALCPSRRSSNPPLTTIRPLQTDSNSPGSSLTFAFPRLFLLAALPPAVFVALRSTSSALAALAPRCVLPVFETRPAGSASRLRLRVNRLVRIWGALAIGGVKPRVDVLPEDAEALIPLPRVVREGAMLAGRDFE